MNTLLEASSTASREAMTQSIVARASIRIRCVQSIRTFPVVLLSLIAVYVALEGRVPRPPLIVWEILMGASVLWRALLGATFLRTLDEASPKRLKRIEGWLWLSALSNAFIIGASFWLVAANGDLTVKAVMTLISCFFAVGALVNASSHFPSLATVTVVHLGQGIMFWLGVGNSTPEIAIAFPYSAVALLMIGFAREYARQFRESLVIRTENADLLTQLAADKRLVEAALDEARKASESKSRFLAAASHDLRQPLHALTMFLGTLSFHVETDDAKRLLNRVTETANMLEEQFNSLLDLSRFDAGAVEVDCKHFRLDLLIERLIEEFREDAGAKEIQLLSHTSRAYVESDRILIRRVLKNLIENAIKYTNAGSVTVTLTEGPTGYRVDVKDTGLGIPADLHSQVFEEYVQLANPARQRHQGAGLGLAIVKRIDDLLGLGLTIESSVGTGSVFSFSLPKAAELDSASPPLSHPLPVEPVKFQKPVTVWVLDDDPTILDSLREQLSVWGAEVRTYGQPDELLAELKAVPKVPNWILTDDMLGCALSGLETAQILSRDYGFGNVCLVTGNTNPVRLRELKASGFPVIIKPARPQVLMALLAEDGGIVH